jgi:hypothetical protein
VTISDDDAVNFEPLVKALPHGAVVTWTQKPIPTTGKFGTRVMAAIVGVASGPPDFAATPVDPAPFAVSGGTAYRVGERRIWPTTSRDCVPHLHLGLV